MPTIYTTNVGHIGILFGIAALLFDVALGREFHSRDAHVAAVITQCEGKIGSSNFPTGDTRCQAVLGCILRTVGNYTSARWSAGASILAFIPTITAVMSNSIEEIVHIAEEDSILAVMLGLCSVTVFASRFGTNREVYTRTTDSIFEHIRFRVARASKSRAAKKRSPGRMHRVIHGIAYFVLLVSCASAWFPTVVVLRNGVVVFSCPNRIHVPLWMGLSQAVVVANVLLLRFMYDRTIVVRQAPQNAQGRSSSRLSDKSLRHLIILRVPKAGFTSRLVRGFTSTITFALYTFGTAIFGAMTMFTASDATWCLVLFAFAAGMGRVVANFIIEDYAVCRRTIVVDVQEYQVDELKTKIEQAT